MKSTNCLFILFLFVNNFVLSDICSGTASNMITIPTDIEDFDLYQYQTGNLCKETAMTPADDCTSCE